MARSLIGLPIRLGLRGAGIAAQGVLAVADQALGLVGRLAGALSGDGTSELDLDGSPPEPRKQRERGGGSQRSAQRSRRGQGRGGDRGQARAGDRPRRTRAGTSRSSRGGPQAVKPAVATEAAADTEAPAQSETPVQVPQTPTQPPAETPPEPPAPPEAQAPAHVSEEPSLVEEVAEPGAEDGAGAEVHVAEPWDGYGELAAEDIIDRITGAATAELAAVELYEQSHRHRQSVLDAVARELRRAGNEPGQSQ